MIILWVVIGCLGLLLLLLLAAVIRTLLEPGKRSDYEPAPNPERAEEYAKKLTSNDRKRVGKLIEYYNNTPVSDDRTQAVLDTLRLMLEKNIKLEQEAL